MLDLLKSTEIVVGLIAAAFGGLSGLVLWIDRRQSRRAKDAVAGVTRDHARSSDTLAKLSDRLGRLEVEVKTGLDDVEIRVSSIERSMESVARQGDIHQIAQVLGKLEGTVQAVSTQTSMLIEARLREESGKRG